MSLPTSPSIDPNGTLVQTLLGHGFTTAQISTAQEKLWISAGSGEGGYDDLNAVGEMLVTMYGGGGARMEKANTSSEGSYATHTSYDTDTDDEDEDERGLKEGEIVWCVALSVFKWLSCLFELRLTLCTGVLPTQYHRTNSILQLH